MVTDTLLHTPWKPCDPNPPPPPGRQITTGPYFWWAELNDSMNKEGLDEVKR